MFDQLLSHASCFHIFSLKGVESLFTFLFERNLRFYLQFYSTESLLSLNPVGVLHCFYQEEYYIVRT